MWPRPQWCHPILKIKNFFGFHAGRKHHSLHIQSFVNFVLGPSPVKPLFYMRPLDCCMIKAEVWLIFFQSEQLLWEQGMEEDLQQAQGRFQTQVVWDQISSQLL